MKLNHTDTKNHDLSVLTVQHQFTVAFTMKLNHTDAQKQGSALFVELPLFLSTLPDLTAYLLLLSLGGGHSNATSCRSEHRLPHTDVRSRVLGFLSTPFPAPSSPPALQSCLQILTGDFLIRIGSLALGFECSVFRFSTCMERVGDTS